MSAKHDRAFGGSLSNRVEESAERDQRQQHEERGQYAVNLKELLQPSRDQLLFER